MDLNYTMAEWILLVTAVGVVINNVITNWKNSSKLDTTVQAVKIIEGHVNSAATKAESDREAAANENIKMQETIEDMRKTAALLAQAVAIKNGVTSVAAAIDESTKTLNVVKEVDKKSKKGTTGE